MNILSLTLALALSYRAFGFCGFYVAKADTQLFNKASQVVLVRDGNKTALTMFSDYKGALSDFAIVIPVPEVLTREQISVGNRADIERLDAFSAPRLVEYFDPDPCAPPIYRMMEGANNRMATRGNEPSKADKSFGVTIEAQYTVGEYDILILNAKESNGLESWLVQNGYKIPKGAAKAIEPYIKQKLKFFVAKVNLKEHAKEGFSYLRPIQFAYESPRFMLPIRLGMVNSDGPQDMFVYTITKKGRVETTNYRTVKIPSDLDIPVFIKQKFPDFYKSMFEVAYQKEGKKVLFTEYAWDMSWCDPCAAEPLKKEELKRLGVFWLDETNEKMSSRPIVPPMNGPVNAYLTRLHVRYDQENFPEDLSFQETSDTSTFQGKYIMNHPWAGTTNCPLAKDYGTRVQERRQKEAENLAKLTQWKMEDIQKEMGNWTPKESEKSKSRKWFQNIFK